MQDATVPDEKVPHVFLFVTATAVLLVASVTVFTFPVEL